MLEKGEFQKAEVLFKQAIKGVNVPNAYYGLALLYRMAGEFKASKDVLETMFVRIPQQTLPTFNRRRIAITSIEIQITQTMEKCAGWRGKSRQSSL